ncbi:MAG TPA: hypothetical protein EYO98_02695 [Candidatus Poseidoniales archaeon]|nr:hypothetical protein [Candidatus Poseidoniales archaeon]
MPGNPANRRRSTITSAATAPFLIASGVSTETIHSLDAQGLAVPNRVRTYQRGEVCAADEPDIHQISNDAEHELINIHIYTPPLYAFNVYEAASGTTA